jgi:xanthine dehydrogenase accessory factor
MFDNFYTRAHELTQQGAPFATATVVRAENPSSGKPGDKAIITADGTMYGWIGGSCAQPAVVREAIDCLRRDESCFLRLSPNPHEQTPRPGLRDVAMTCFSGGTLEIFIEAHQPRPRLVIVGNLPVARALAELGRAMNYHIVLVDPGHTDAPPAYADELLTDLTQIGARVAAHTAIVVATHGQYDELALEQALATSASYVGLVASRRRAEAVRSYLIDQGLGDGQLQRLVAPAGIDIHARRGDEIALSIMAEIVQRYRTSRPALIELPLAPQAAEPLSYAIDPICGMQVTIAGARYTYEDAGTTYYFCCPGCRTTFRKAAAGLTKS